MSFAAGGPPYLPRSAPGCPQRLGLATVAWRCYGYGAMLRKLLVSLLAIGVTSILAGALVWSMSGNAAWAQVERKNCPAGFHWERMSGQCCVQDYETIPEHGRIGYTGNSICDDGYAATYEQRPTTDGQGPPGCPGYTSFAFLISCARSADSTSGEGISIRDLSEAVFHGGSAPSVEELAAVGGLSTGVLVLSSGAIVVLRRRPVPVERLLEEIRARPEPGDVNRAWREWRAALEQFELIRQKLESLRSRREELIREFAEVIRLIQEYERTGKWTATQVLGTLIGLAAGLVTKGAAWIPWAMRGVGSATTLGAGLYKGHLADVRRDLKAALVRVDNDIYAVDDQLDKLKRVYEIADKRVKDTHDRYEALRTT